MAREEKSTQPEVTENSENQAQNSASTQPEVKVRDLDIEEATEAPQTEPQQEAQEDKTEERSQSDSELVALLQEQKETIEDLKKGLYDQGRKIAAEGPQADNVEETNEEAQAKETLQNMGFIDKDLLRKELETIEQKQEDKRRLDQICDSNPDVNRNLLETLGRAEPEVAWEDLIDKFNLNKGKSLAKAHDRPIKGFTQREEPKQKAVRDMSDQEFKEFLQTNSSGTIHSSYI